MQIEKLREEDAMRPRSKRPGGHHRSSRRGAAWAAVIFSAVLVAGCSSGQNSPATTGSSAESPSARPESAPFTIVAQYSAKSLDLLRPLHLAIGPDGNLYIPDAKQRINVISPQGKVLRRWGSPGRGAGQFHFVRHDTSPDVIGETARVAVADGHVYVADSGNARVQVFTAEGRFLHEYGRYGSGRSEWLFPTDVVVDRDGGLYVQDDKGEVLWRFSPSGTPEWQIRASETTDDDLAGPLHLAGVDSHNRLVVVNDGKAKVVYVDRRGHKVDAFGAGDQDQACDGTIDSSGNVYVGTCAEPLDSPHALKIFDRTHQLIASWDPSPMGFPPTFGPKGEIFALGEDGSVLQLVLNLPAR
jgi:DNA-binding beta-propeller fold protein YncE